MAAAWMIALLPAGLLAWFGWQLWRTLRTRRALFLGEAGDDRANKPLLYWTEVAILGAITLLLASWLFHSLDQARHGLGLW